MAIDYEVVVKAVSEKILEIVSTSLIPELKKYIDDKLSTLDTMTSKQTEEAIKKGLGLETKHSSEGLTLKDVEDTIKKCMLSGTKDIGSVLQKDAMPSPDGNVETKSKITKALDEFDAKGY